jgi:hypothetical protein
VGWGPRSPDVPEVTLDVHPITALALAETSGGRSTR